MSASQARVFPKEMAETRHLIERTYREGDVVRASMARLRPMSEEAVMAPLSARVLEADRDFTALHDSWRERRLASSCRRIAQLPAAQ